MGIQESAQRLEQLQHGFEDATRSLTQIFTDLKISTPVIPSSGAPITTKLAASAALIADITEVMRTASETPDLVEVAIQLGKIGDKIRIALPGGAVLSDQETAWIESQSALGTPTPANLFYQLAQEQLLTNGTLNFTYDLELARASFTDSLRANLKRELGEELGDHAAQGVQVGSFLPGERTTTLSSISLPDLGSMETIAASLSDRGVVLTPDRKLQGIYTVVTERVAVAHGPLSEIEKHATDNVEAKGIRVKGLAELLDISQRTAASIESYRSYKTVNAENLDRHGSDGVRNPSTTWGLSLLTAWLQGKVLEQETYREGPRSNPLNKTEE